MRMRWKPHVRSDEPMGDGLEARKSAQEATNAQAAAAAELRQVQARRSHVDWLHLRFEQEMKVNHFGEALRASWGRRSEA